MMNETQKHIKGDSVKAFLTEYMEEHKDSETAKFLFYANKNGSGLKSSSTKESEINETNDRRSKLEQKIKSKLLHPELEFDYKDMVPSFKKVDIKSRVSHTISSYLQALQVANAIITKIHVANSHGFEWPSRSSSTNEEVVKINIQSMNSFISHVKNELVTQLPIIVDAMYIAKSHPQGSFVLQLAKIKPYKCVDGYVQALVASINGSEYVQELIKVGQLVANGQKSPAMMWTRYTLSSTDTSKIVPSDLYQRLAKTLATRIGKNIFDASAFDKTTQNVTSIINHSKTFFLPQRGVLVQLAMQSGAYLSDKSTKLLDETYVSLVENDRYQFQSNALDTLILVYGDVVRISMDAAEKFIRELTNYATTNVALDSHFVASDLLMLQRLPTLDETLNLISNANDIGSSRLMSAVFKILSIYSDLAYSRLNNRGIKKARKQIPAQLQSYLYENPQILTKMGVPTATQLEQIHSEQFQPLMVIDTKDHNFERVLETYPMLGYFKTIHTHLPLSKRHETGLLQKGIMSLGGAATNKDVQVKDEGFGNFKTVVNVLEFYADLLEESQAIYLGQSAKEEKSTKNHAKKNQEQDKAREKFLALAKQQQENIEKVNRVFTNTANCAYPQASSPAVQPVDNVQPQYQSTTTTNSPAMTIQNNNYAHTQSPLAFVQNNAIDQPYSSYAPEYINQPQVVDSPMSTSNSTHASPVRLSQGNSFDNNVNSPSRVMSQGSFSQRGSQVKSRSNSPSKVSGDKSSPAALTANLDY